MTTFNRHAPWSSMEERKTNLTPQIERLNALRKEYALMKVEGMKDVEIAEALGMTKKCACCIQDEKLWLHSNTD